MEKELIEKAAEEYAQREWSDAGQHGDDIIGRDMAIPFIAGAEWMSEQNGWISVEDQVPNEGQEIFILFLINGIPNYGIEIFYRSRYIDHCGKWIHGNNRVCAWMPIPFFTEK